MLAGREAVGVVATNDRNEILALDADVVLHAPQLRPDGLEQLDRDLTDLLGRVRT